MSDFSFKEELEIDPDALDVEWLMQPQLFVKYAELYVNAEAYFESTKERLEFVRATIDNKIRNTPKAYTSGDKKLTETSINSLILTDPEYMEAATVHNAAKKTFKSLGIAVKAFEQRKSALENLVKLHGQSYFASPNASSDRTLSDSINASIKRREEAHDKIKRRMDKKRSEIADQDS